MARTDQSVAAFVPMLMRRRALLDPRSIDEPRAARIHATALFADISGFSRLADRLTRKGPEGSEALTGILNAHFEQMIEIVHDFGGDVMKFAGDGIVALWPADEGDLRRTTLLAAQCASRMHLAVHDRPRVEDVNLSVHSGIGTGEAAIYDVGGAFGRWESLLFGPPFVQMGIAANTAAQGEIVLSREAWAHAAGAVRGEAVGGVGWRLHEVIAPVPRCAVTIPVLSPEAELALHPLVPRSIVSRLAAGESSWFEQLRQITVMFVNLPDIDLSLSLDRAQKIMEVIQAAVYRFEGSINQIGVDDKGVTVIAAMGLPPLAHEDDALRGAQAALGIQSGLRGLGVRHSAGLSSGRVFCGVIGARNRRQYTIIGDTVNLAARLMQAGDADVLCDAATRAAACDRLVFEALPPTRLKGKSESVPLYRPIRKVVGEADSRPIVGRLEERALLRGYLEEAQRGSGGVAVVEGEPGLGKSRLLAKLVEEAAAAGVPVFSGAADAVERSTAYHAWRPVFTRLAGIEDGDSAEARRAKAAGYLAASGIESALLPLLNGVLSLDVADNEVTGRMTGQIRADNANDLLLGLLAKEVDRQPCVLVLEDAHWLDSASWSLALLLGQRSPTILFVLTTRPVGEPATPEFVSLRTQSGKRWIRLEPMAQADVLALVCRRLGVSSLPAEIGELIQAKAEGNPFFSEELVMALWESGIVLVEDGRSRIAPGCDLASVHLPDSVQGVITGRIDRLSHNQQLTLKVASVIGRVFTLRVLREIYPIEADRELLSGHLAMLDRLDLTPRDANEPDPAYVFKHVITQEVAYNLMLFAQRRQLHRAIAEWFETRHAEDLASFYPLLAHHWLRAEDLSRAIDYLEAAGDQALREGAYEEAIGFFNQALAAATRSTNLAAVEPFRRAGWERRIGEAMMGLGKFEECKEHTEKSLAIHGFRVQRRPLALALSFLVQGGAQLFHRWFPSFVLGRCGENRQTFLELAQAYERVAHVTYYAGEIFVGVNSALTGLNLAERAGPAPELARAYSTTALALSLLTFHRFSEYYVRRAFAVLESVNDSHAATWVLEVTGTYGVSNGHWKRGRDWLERAVELTARLGDWRRWEECMIELAFLHCARGDFRSTVRVAEQTRETARARNHAQAQIMSVSFLALTYLRLDQFAKAREALEEGLRLSVGDYDVADKIWLHGVEAIVRMHLGDLDSARRAAAFTQSLIRQTIPMANYALEGYCAVAEFYLTLWESGESTPEIRLCAAAACVDAVRCAKSFPVGKPRGMLFAARLQRLNGKAAASRKILRKALAAAEELKAPYEEALVRFHLAWHLPPHLPERQEQMRKACAIFEDLGALLDLKRASSSVGLAERDRKSGIFRPKTVSLPPR